MSNSIQASAAIIHAAKGQFSLEPVEIAAPRATEVRVRMVGTGICHTDIMFRDADGFGLPVPCVLGHEGAGVVEAIGSDVKGHAVGDHVVLCFMSCGHCYTCQHGYVTHCEHAPELNYSGGRGSPEDTPVSQNGQPIHAAFFNQSSFATYTIADQRNAVKISKDVPLELMGPLGCGVVTGAGGAINSLAIKAGDTLAVFGGGSVGLSAMLGALAVGAGPVIVVEPNDGRCKFAVELGAAHAINPTTTPDVVAELVRLSGGGVTHAIDTTGIPSVIETACNVLRNGGKLGLIGTPPADAMFPMQIMGILARGMTIKGIVEGDADPQQFIPELVALYRKGMFPFDKLITKFPFAQINAAVEAAEHGTAIKPVLIF